MVHTHTHTQNGAKENLIKMKHTKTKYTHLTLDVSLCCCCCFFLFDFKFISYEHNLICKGSVCRKGTNTQKKTLEMKTEAKKSRCCYRRMVYRRIQQQHRMLCAQCLDTISAQIQFILFLRCSYIFNANDHNLSAFGEKNYFIWHFIENNTHFRTLDRTDHGTKEHTKYKYITGCGSPIFDTFRSVLAADQFLPFSVSLFFESSRTNSKGQILCRVEKRTKISLSCTKLVQLKTINEWKCKRNEAMKELENGIVSQLLYTCSVSFVWATFWRIVRCFNLNMKFEVYRFFEL